MKQEQERQAVEQGIDEVRDKHLARYQGDYHFSSRLFINDVAKDAKRAVLSRLAELNKPSDDLVHICIANFDNIAKQCDRVTTANLPHNIMTIKGIALRCSEYLNKHKNEG